MQLTASLEAGTSLSKKAGIYLISIFRIMYNHVMVFLSLEAGDVVTPAFGKARRSVVQGQLWFHKKLDINLGSETLSQ